jgi:diacylglycerol kinase (ATP)
VEPSVEPTPFGRPLLIMSSRGDADPRSLWRARIESALQARGIGFEFEAIEEPQAATAAARAALGRGVRFLVAVGGDALVHHLANGLFSGGRAVDADAVFGIIPLAGEGDPTLDFARTFGLPEDPARAIAHLEGEGLYPIDAGVVRFVGGDGSEATRHFFNVAQAGLGGSIVSLSSRLPKALGRSRRFFGFWASLATSRPARVVLSGDRRSWEGSVRNIVVANGQYNADGVKISPRSWPGDGYLEVLVMTGPRSDAFTILPRAYRGEHLPHRNIVEYRCRRLSIESDRPLQIEADGNVLGTTPATFEVIPRSLRLKV